MGNGETHPDLLELDALRTGHDADRLVAAHVEACATCQATLAELTALAHDLKSMHAPAVAAAQERDAQILWRARGHAARIRHPENGRRRRGIAAPATWAAAAAALLALATGLWVGRRGDLAAPNEFGRFSAARPAAPSTAATDFDADGRVTILDAFALARRLEADASASGIDQPARRVDRHEVDAVAALAVSVGGA